MQYLFRAMHEFLHHSQSAPTPGLDGRSISWYWGPNEDPDQKWYIAREGNLHWKEVSIGDLAAMTVH